jgi:hypothetical protein
MQRNKFCARVIDSVSACENLGVQTISGEKLTQWLFLGERLIMRAHQIVTRTVITVRTGTSILEAANLMLREHIGGLSRG